MKNNNYETKIRLLKEVLTKKNKDFLEADENNKELVNFIEECNLKMNKLDEDFKLEKIKTEKYEIKLGLIDDDFKKIDVDTLDGRINFLVNLLEQYRKMLEEEDSETSEGVYHKDMMKEEHFTPKKKQKSMNNKKNNAKNGELLDIDEEDKMAIKAQKYYFYNTRVSI